MFHVRPRITGLARNSRRSRAGLAALAVNQVGAPVLCPRRFIMAYRQGFFLAETDRFQLRVGYTQGLEFMEHGFGASFTERQVVFRRSPFVGITLDQYMSVWVASEILRVGLQKRLIVAFDGVTVEVEVDAAFRKWTVGVVKFIDLGWRDVGRLRASCATHIVARCLIQFWPGMTSREDGNQQRCNAKSSTFHDMSPGVDESSRGETVRSQGRFADHPTIASGQCAISRAALSLPDMWLEHGLRFVTPPG